MLSNGRPYDQIPILRDAPMGIGAPQDFGLFRVIRGSNPNSIICNLHFSFCNFFSVHPPWVDQFLLSGGNYHSGVHETVVPIFFLESKVPLHLNIPQTGAR